MIVLDAVTSFSEFKRLLLAHRLVEFALVDRLDVSVHVLGALRIKLLSFSVVQIQNSGGRPIRDAVGAFELLLPFWDIIFLEVDSGLLDFGLAHAFADK